MKDAAEAPQKRIRQPKLRHHLWYHKSRVLATPEHSDLFQAIYIFRL